MFYPRSERQAHFVTLAQGLAQDFAKPRAAEHDRQGSFPVENFQKIRAAGLPALVIPEEYGGWGADLLETVMTMEALATGDGSTALSLTMHMQTMGTEAETRSWPAASFARICREIATDNVLINSLATEPELGSPSREGKPKTTATPLSENGSQPVAWEISGRKNFASMAPALDYMIIPASLQDGSEDVARFIVPVGEGVEIVETWDALGMRSTGSHDVVLTNVPVLHNQMIARSDPTKLTEASNFSAWFMLTISGVYLGVATAALRTAACFAQERVPTALGRPIATLESIQRRLGEVELLLHQARTHIYHAAHLWDRHPDRRQELMPSVIVAKVTATNNAIAAVDHCMRVVGGASMTKRLPLERYYRDVRGGLLHPVNDDQALILLGQLALREVVAPPSSH